MNYSTFMAFPLVEGWAQHRMCMSLSSWPLGMAVLWPPDHAPEGMRFFGLHGCGLWMASTRGLCIAYLLASVEVVEQQGGKCRHCPDFQCPPVLSVRTV